MSKITKAWLIVATVLILIGFVILGGALSMLKWNFNKLATKAFETNTHTVNETFTDISIVTDTADVVFATAEDGACTVVCYENTDFRHTVTVKDGTLVIEGESKRKWYDNINIFTAFSHPKITVYLPEGEYGALSTKSDTGSLAIPKEFTFTSIVASLKTGDVKCFASSAGNVSIQTSTGNISVEGIRAASLTLSVSTGDVFVLDTACEGDVNVTTSTGGTSLINLTCQNLTTTGNTGYLSMQWVMVTANLSAKRTTGDIKFEGCDAAELTLETNTGDIKGSLLSEKIFLASSGTGKVQVPECVTGGRCKATTSTGNIKLRIQE